MSLENADQLQSITEENFKKGVHEGISEIIEVIRNVASKYFKKDIYPQTYIQSDMVNFYLNIFANTLFSVHVQIIQKIDKTEIERLIEIFSAHIMRIFLHQKESRENENNTTQ